ncbi:MAG: adenylyl-sulfate kinase, partial [Coriobacteriia bacterium]|nr:adenylyl-sulfate kinase [Coriobacteriia bacterium]
SLRDYVIHDAPGHVEFVKNMVTGAARADAALLLIDVHEGVQENSRRHGHILSMLGIRQVAVVVNKMDLVDYDRVVFDELADEYAAFLGRLGTTPERFIPVAAREGVNVSARSPETPWYDGPSVLEQLESFTTAEDGSARPFRMPVQDIYKFTAHGDDRRIVAGTIETGLLRAGDEVVFLPSGKRSRVRAIEAFATEPPEAAEPGRAVGFTLAEQVYVRRGELATRAGQPAPEVASRFRANVLWLGRAPMVRGKRYLLKIGAAQAPVELAGVESVVDASELASREGVEQLERHDVGECVLESSRPVAFDLAGEIEATSRFVIVDDFDIAGFGTVVASLAAKGSLLADRVRERERAWDRGDVTTGERSRRYGHTGKSVVFVGPERGAARELARALERHLFSLGAHAYYLGLSDGLQELDPGVGGVLEREDHLRRLGELARVMTDAGVVFVTAFEGVDPDELERLRLLNEPYQLLAVSVGVEQAAKIGADLELPLRPDIEEGVGSVLRRLGEAAVVPEYWI